MVKTILYLFLFIRFLIPFVVQKSRNFFVRIVTRRFGPGTSFSELEGPQLAKVTGTSNGYRDEPGEGIPSMGEWPLGDFPFFLVKSHLSALSGGLQWCLVGPH